jgi:peroxiredoxin
VIAGSLLLALRLMLALVFGAAGLAKVTRPAAQRETAVRFGLPRPLAPAAIAIPIAELAVAAMLLAERLAWVGALAALALLTVFTAAVATQLARGRRPECNCFGAIHAKPVGVSTLARNTVFLACAAAVVVAGHTSAGPSAFAWIGHLLPAAIVGLSLVVMTQTVLLVMVLRRHGRALLRLDEIESRHGAGLAVGEPAPEVTLPDLDGEPLTLSELRAPGLPVLIVFSHPACGPCAALLPEVGRWQREHDHELVVALVSGGDVEDDRARAAEHGLTWILRDDDDAVARAYGATGTPMAVVVDPDGRIASEFAVGAEAIRGLVSTIVDRTSREVLVGV